jgi:hypothetical protein
MPVATPSRYPRDARLDTPKYLFGDVLRATNVTAPVLKAWLSRAPKVIALGAYDQDARGKGSARLFTLRRVLSIGITAELVRLGIKASHAGLLGYTYTDAFAPREKWDLLVENETTPFLVAYPDSEIISFAEMGSLRNLLFLPPTPNREPQPASMAVVHCGRIAQRIVSSLEERGT